MVMVNLVGKMEKNILVFIKMILKKVLEFIFMNKNLFKHILGFGLKEKWMGLEW